MRAARQSKRSVGAPSKLEPNVKRLLLQSIEGGATCTDAARRAGIDVATFHRWRQRGEFEPAGQYRDFCDDLEFARVQRREWYRTTITDLALAKKDYRGIAWLATVTEPEVFSPKVHLVIEQELRAAVDRLMAEFRDEPDLLERTLVALTTTPVGSRVEDEIGPKVVSGLPAI